jgi:hypothetical protein
MKITVTDPEGAVHKAKQPYGGSKHVTTTMTCPHCKAENISVSGTGKHKDPEASYDTYKAQAFHASTECGKAVGTLRCKVGTFFGLEEDERILDLGVKIY